MIHGSVHMSSVSFSLFRPCDHCDQGPLSFVKVVIFCTLDIRFILIRISHLRHCPKNLETQVSGEVFASENRGAALFAISVDFTCSHLLHCMCLCIFCISSTARFLYYIFGLIIIAQWTPDFLQRCNFVSVSPVD